MPRNRSICFNIKLEEYERKEKTMDGAVYTPDSCCYAWTNYYTVVNYGGREIRFKNNYTYCEPYEKSKIEETIKTVKDKYKNYDENMDFDMFIDCGDKQGEKEGEKEREKEGEKKREKEGEKEEKEKDNQGSNEDYYNKGNINNNLYIILNMCFLLILIF